MLWAEPRRYSSCHSYKLYRVESGDLKKERYETRETREKRVEIVEFAVFVAAHAMLRSDVKRCEAM